MKKSMEKSMQKFRELRAKVNSMSQKLREMKRKQVYSNYLIFSLSMYVIYLVYEVTLRIYDLYMVTPVVGAPSHFFAGLGTGALLFLVFKSHNFRRVKTLSVFCSFLIAGLWELLEHVQEMIFYNPPTMIDYFFWDGFWDMVLFVLGSILALYAVNYLFHRKIRI
ncbi:hypothetical protein KY316_01670 [Candidatus Woesearchaeota archaeon]|nr:hypothetical protein [Candidatus Woesearchaeota archaeon]